MPSGSPSTSGSPKSSKPRKKTSTAEKSSDGMMSGRLTDSATRKGDAPATRAASSTSDPRLFSAADAYTYTLGTCVRPAITVMAGNVVSGPGGAPESPRPHSRYKTNSPHGTTQPHAMTVGDTE